MILSLKQLIICFHSLSAIELLNCIQHLLSWIASNELLQEQFLLNLIDLASWKEVKQ